MKRHVVVMAKPPLMGRAKTRLSAEVGAARAASFNRVATARLLSRLGGDPRWTVRLCVNARASERYACWPDRTLRMRQGGGSLGDRMRRAADALPPGPVVILGTDTPQVEPRDVAEAFAALGAADAVFGPSGDGGFWLIGLARRRPAPGLYDGVQWSSEHALTDTRASLPERFEVGTMRTLTDVDDAAGLAALAEEWGPVRRGPWRQRVGR